MKSTLLKKLSAKLSILVIICGMTLPYGLLSADDSTGSIQVSITPAGIADSATYTILDQVTGQNVYGTTLTGPGLYEGLDIGNYRIEFNDQADYKADDVAFEITTGGQTVQKTGAYYQDADASTGRIEVDIQPAALASIAQYQILDQWQPSLSLDRGMPGQSLD